VYSNVAINDRGTDHRKHSAFILARIRFRGNLFTEPLPNSEPFQLSGVMSQYFYIFEVISR
jgi:hypothetical protein